jgi:hypothetical protein
MFDYGGSCMSDQSYPDLTPQELDALSEKLIDEFLGDIPKQPPIEWGTGAWKGPHIELDPDDPFGDMYSIFNRGIHVTSIVPPEHGWPIAFYCPICKETTFLLSLWANKTKDGDYFKMNDVCASDEHSYAHNMTMAMKLPPAYMKY